MTRLWRPWVELWDRREDPRPLALVRIAVALVLLYDFVEIARIGAIEPLWAAAPEGYAARSDGWGAALGARGLWFAAVIALVAIATGTLTRVACVAFVLISAQLSQLAPDGERGIDALLRIAIAILALSQSHARWSVDALVWRRLGRPFPDAVPAWPRYLLLLQLLWVYVSGGLNKGGVEWGPSGGFEALANALADPNLARFDPGWIEAFTPLARIATAAVMAFELAAPLYLVVYYFAATRDRPGRLRAWCNRLRLRWIWIALGVSFHVGIAATLRLGIFPWGMLALYPVLALPRVTPTPCAPAPRSSPRDTPPRRDSSDPC